MTLPLFLGFILLCVAVLAVWISTVLYIVLTIFVCGVVSLGIWFAAYLQPRNVRGGI